jgi:hypothetical protein
MDITHKDVHVGVDGVVELKYYPKIVVSRYSMANKCSVRVVKVELPAVIVSPAELSVDEYAYFVAQARSGCMVFEPNIWVVEVVNYPVFIQADM